LRWLTLVQLNGQIRIAGILDRLLACTFAIVARALAIHGRLDSALVGELRRLCHGGRALRRQYRPIIS
jgi:hypothetical protein